MTSAEHAVYEEPSAHALRINAEWQSGNYHTVFLPCMFPVCERGITGILMCLTKQKHQISHRQTLAAWGLQAVQSPPPVSAVNHSTGNISAAPGRSSVETGSFCSSRIFSPGNGETMCLQ